MKKLSITAIIQKSDDGWYVGQLEEFPEVISQGKTVDELKENLIDALGEALEIRREQTQKEYSGRKVIRRKIFA